MSRIPKYEDVLAGLASRYAAQAAFEFDMEMVVGVSPIEHVFIGALLVHSWLPSMRLGMAETRAAEDAIAAVGLYPNEPRPDWENDPQRLFASAIGHAFCVSEYWLDLEDRRIRPDFAFVFPGGLDVSTDSATNVIVELDGHDFHERTYEQAQSDKSRDRQLQARGWHVLRFTGREVLRSPSECLTEVLKLLFAKSVLERSRRIESGP